MKRILLIICLALLSLNGLSQEDSLPELNPYFSAIIVSDIDTSINWYVKHFGFKLINRSDANNKDFQQANLERHNSLLELIEIKTSVKTDELLKDYPKRTLIEGYFKFGFVVSDFDSWLEHLNQSEVELHGSVVTNSLNGKRMLIVKDPDGNRIQLFEKK